MLHLFCDVVNSNVIWDGVVMWVVKKLKEFACFFYRGKLFSGNELEIESTVVLKPAKSRKLFGKNTLKVFMDSL